jgi:cell surface protein SprA
LELLFSKLSNTGSGENYDDAVLIIKPKKYVYRNMYRNTQSGALQDIDKNKFLLGKYKSTGGDGIPIGAFNVPRGSVVVTGWKNSSGRVDYSVNYQLGEYKF